MHLLSIHDLVVKFRTRDGTVHAVNGVTFDLDEGETLGLVGESGCGKTVTNLALMRLLPQPAGHIEGGEVIFEGQEILSLEESDMRDLRGKELAMIFQDPMTSLNPVLTVGDQIMETIMLHQHKTRAQAYKRAIEMLELVRIPEPQKRINSYPHQFSGGMRQRVMIAMALSCDPQLLIADEPTTALDVTIQAQILDELRQLRDETDAGVILVTHDLGVVADIADRVIVMYGGRVVEQGTLDDIFYDPQHPYTWGLLGSITRVDSDRSQRLPAIPGQPPSLLRPPQGCHFRPRCPHAFDRCTEVPALENRNPDNPSNRDRCWLTPEQKRRLRQVGDQIGLASPEAVIS
jgi:peptide/nickel transport system ATP-binding protein